MKGKLAGGKKKGGRKAREREKALGEGKSMEEIKDAERSKMAVSRPKWESIVAIAVTSEQVKKRKGTGGIMVKGTRRCQRIAGMCLRRRMEGKGILRGLWPNGGILVVGGGDTEVSASG